MQIVEVEWVDSQAFDGWHGSEEMKNWNDSLVCKSVGYLLRESEDRMVLVMSESFGSGALDNGMTIPRVAIIQIRHLTKREPDARKSGAKIVSSKSKRSAKPARR